MILSNRIQILPMIRRISMIAVNLTPKKEAGEDNSDEDRGYDAKSCQ